MYKIIGGNQAEYGPVSTEQLRQWIAEGRVNADTLAQAAGETGWKPISSYPDFAASFPPKASVPPPLSAPPPALASSIPDGSRARALEDVSSPAIGLMVAGTLGIAYALFGLLMNLAGFTANSLDQLRSMNLPGQNPEMLRLLQNTGGAIGIGFSCLHLAASVLVIFGGLKMKKLESHGLCILASAVALIPCFCPCCMVSIPIGIWALVTLNKPEVRSHFT